MVEVESPLPGAAFPHSTSLYMPERFSESLIDPSSYTPYPSFPGSNDAAALNAYLFLAEAGTWDVLDSTPRRASSLSSASSPALVEPSGMEGLGTGSRAGSGLGTESSAGPSKHLLKVPSPDRGRRNQKQRSYEVLRRPSPLRNASPLSQSPVSAEDESPKGRARSNSVDSPRLDLQPPLAPSPSPAGGVLRRNTPSMSGIGKTSLRKAWRFSKLNVFRSPEAVSSAVPGPPRFTGSSSSTPGASEETESSTSSSSSGHKSDSQSSSDSASTSTSSSSEGVRTPAEGSQVQVDVAGVRLAEILGLNASPRRLSWRVWSRRNPHSVSRSSSSSSSVPSPSTSSVDLSLAVPPVPQPTPELLISDEPPSRVAGSPVPSVVSPAAPPAHSWVGEQLRRSSLRKMATLRRPSPHPLALHLRRQNSPLPDEVAFTLQAGQKVFPRSVNTATTDLGPTQGGLRTVLAIHSIMKHLDAGHLPTGTITPRRMPSDAAQVRAKGIKDFISRPPYEERMLVYFPEDVFSHVSSARPGFGLEDLEFSAYILALSRVDDSSSGNGNGNGNHGAIAPIPNVLDRTHLVEMVPSSTSAPEVVENRKDETNTPTQQGETVGKGAGKPASTQPLRDVEDSPPLETLLTPPLETLPQAERSPVVFPSPTESVVPRKPSKSTSPPPSSFRHRSPPVSWAESETSDSEEDEPLARVARRSVSFSQSVTSFPPQRRDSPVKVHMAPASCSTTSLTRPAMLAPRPVQAGPAKPYRDSRLSKEMSEVQQRNAMEEVARARERREAAISGETERRAEMERRRIEDAKRSSILPSQQQLGGEHVIRPKRSMTDGQDLHWTKEGTSNNSNSNASNVKSDKSSTNLSPTSTLVDSGPGSPISTSKEMRRRTKSTLDLPHPDLKTPRPSERRYHSFYETPSAPAVSPQPQPNHLPELSSRNLAQLRHLHVQPQSQYPAPPQHHQAYHPQPHQHQQMMMPPSPSMGMMYLQPQMPGYSVPKMGAYPGMPSTLYPGMGMPHSQSMMFPMVPMSGMCPAQAQHPGLRYSSSVLSLSIPPQDANAHTRRSSRLA